MAGQGIRELVGRAMIDREFLAELVRDPDRVLADFELTTEERAAIMQAAGRRGNMSEHERVRELQVVLMKRWAT